MTTATETRPAPALARAITDYQRAADRFAHSRHIPGELGTALVWLRMAGEDPVTGLISIPVNALNMADVLADGRRAIAANGSITGGPVWLAFNDGTSREFPAWELIEIRGPNYRR